LVSFISAAAQLQKACEIALQNGRPPISENLGETIYTLKVARRNLVCARETLAPYASAKNTRTIHASAGIGVSAVEKLIASVDAELAVNHQLLEATDRAIAGKDSKVSVAQLIEKMTDIGVEENTAWEWLVKATEAAFYSLADPVALERAKASAPDEEDWRRLTITSNQRNELLFLLQSTFGSSVTTGVKPNVQDRTSVQTQADFLYQAISDERWKAHDQ